MRLTKKTDRPNELAIVLASRTKSKNAWEALARTRPVLVVDSLEVLDSFVRGSLVNGGECSTRVVIDQSVEADRFVKFLKSLPPDFAGEVFYVRPDGRGLLTGACKGDGRRLLEFDPVDVDMYLDATLGMDPRSRREAPGGSSFVPRLMQGRTAAVWG